MVQELYTNFFDELTKYKLIKPARKVRNAQLYHIDMDFSAVKAFNAFQNILAATGIKKEFGRTWKSRIYGWAFQGYIIYLKMKCAVDLAVKA